MNSSNVLSIYVDPQIMNYTDCTVSGLGIISVAVAIQYEKVAIAFFSILLTIIASLHSASNLALSEKRIVNGIIAADAIVSVFLTISIAYTLRLYKTPIGIFRVLWLILLVTSSSSYAAISAFTGQSYIPNDITVIAIGVSIIILIFMSIYARCRKRHQTYEPSVKHLVSEYALVVGALMLRFETEIASIVSVFIGWTFWHLSCWISSITCSTIKYEIEEDTPTMTRSSSETNI